MGLSLFEQIKTGIIVPGTGAEGSGDLTLVGSDTSESTTTSITAVDLVTISGLSIPTTSPILITFSFRRTAGAFAPNVCGFGLKINSTVVAEALDDTNAMVQTGNIDAIQDGWARVEIPPRETNYLNAGFSWFQCTNSSTGVRIVDNREATTYTAAYPNATITSITIRCRSADNTVTAAAKDIFVYTRAT